MVNRDLDQLLGMGNACDAEKVIVQIIVNLIVLLQDLVQNFDV